MPGADYRLVKLIGLKPCVKRFMIYNQGCAAGATAIRLAKDLVENNTDARVLIVCSDIMAACFQPPSETHLDTLVMSALFGDGAAAMIVGVNPDTTVKERPLFEIVSAEQTIILPDSEDIVVGKVREMGTMYYISKELPEVIPKYLEHFLIETFGAFGADDWNRLFYVVHPGGPAILKGIEQQLGLRDNKLKASWHVLREYGNMMSPSVFFVLDEMRKMSIEEGKAITTFGGLELGVLLGVGPGLTVETVVLRSPYTARI